MPVRQATKWALNPKPDSPGGVLCKCTTSFVTSTPDATIRTHTSFQRVVRTVLENSDITSVYFDLDECERCDPGGLLLLRYAGETLTNNGRQCFVMHSGPSESFEMITENINHLWERTSGIRKEPPADGKYLLRFIEDQDAMVSEINEWAAIVKTGTDANPEEVACWEMQIAEVATNTFQHGKVTGIWVAGHFYKDDKTVQLAAIDYGATIPAVISQVGAKHRVPDGDGNLIEFACKPGITSRCVRWNQGSGLVSLVNSVRLNQGTMQILSRNGLFHVNNRRKSRRNFRTELTTLAGTLILLTLNVGQI